MLRLSAASIKFKNYVLAEDKIYHIIIPIYNSIYHFISRIVLAGF